MQESLVLEIQELAAALNCTLSEVLTQGMSYYVQNYKRIDEEAADEAASTTQKENTDA
jgi:hypothetical protein